MLVILFVLLCFPVASSSGFFLFNETENEGPTAWSGQFRHAQCSWVMEDHTAIAALAYAKRTASLDSLRLVVEERRSERILCYSTRTGNGPELFKAAAGGAPFPLLLAIEYRFWLVPDPDSSSAAECADSETCDTATSSSLDEGSDDDEYFVVVYQNVFGQRLDTQSLFSLESLVRRSRSAAAPHVGPPQLSVVSFNLWNYNEAWPDRCKMIADIVVAKGTDVVMVQEVRFDSLFLGHHYVSPSQRKRAFHSGSQAEQFYHCLMAATSAAAAADHTEQGETQAKISKWNFVSERAMYYLHFEGSGWVDAEGLATFVRADVNLIRDRRFLRLPRTIQDPVDEHQRLCLHVQLDSGVDLLNTHFSLSQRPREQGAQAIVDYVVASGGAAGARFQVLAGDLNDVPQSTAVSLLMSQFRDVWENSDDNDRSSFTFPTTPGPKKRIDFLLYRQPGGTADDDDDDDGHDSLALVMDMERLCTKPTTLTYVKQRGSPTKTEKVYCSDHFGLFTRFQLPAASTTHRHPVE